MMNPGIKAAVTRFIEQETLPDDYMHSVEHWFLPMLEEILSRIASHHGTYVIGISGSQGSGKSTLAALMVILLREMTGLRAVNLSIDDFYLTRAEREVLAQTAHPLLITRGVPGTHDVDLAVDTINFLGANAAVAIPRFDKAIDDRDPEKDWPVVTAPVDVIVLEGWCLSIGSQDVGELDIPVNDLEREEDPDAVWRRYVNDAIAGKYQALYDLVDFLVMLKAPDFGKVYEWRQTQEDKLAAKKARHAGATKTRIMSPDQLRRFIQHYERLTRHGLLTLPERADVVFQLTVEQTIDTRL